MSRKQRPPGFTLMEVLVATSILLGCVIVLAELARIGRKHAESSRELSTAQLLCQSKLNQLLAGAATVEPVQDQPIEGHPGWVCSVEIGSAGGPGLRAVRVTVSREAPVAASQPLADPLPPAPRQFTLVRWAHALPRAAGAAPAAPGGPSAPVETAPPPAPVLYGGPSQ